MHNDKKTWTRIVIFVVAINMIIGAIALPFLT